MRTLTTIVETLKIASMVAGATIGIINEGMDKVKNNSKLCDAATKESFKDLLTSNAECTKELSRAMIEYPISLFMSDSKPLDIKVEEPKQEEEEVIVTPNTNTTTQA